MKHMNVNLKIVFDKKPNGTFKSIDSSLAKSYGWKHKTKFEKGISIAINDYLKNHLKKKSLINKVLSEVSLVEQDLLDQI